MGVVGAIWIGFEARIRAPEARRQLLRALGISSAAAGRGQLSRIQMFLCMISIS